MLFYKDKDGFETLFSEFGNSMVYPNETRAKAEHARTLNKIEDLLDPMVIYKTKGFFIRKIERVKPVSNLKEHERTLMIQIKNTLFFRKVSIA